MRVWRSLLILTALMSAVPSHGMRKLWCDKGLSREPLEMKFFRADLKSIEFVRLFKTDERGEPIIDPDYPSAMLTAIRGFFEQPRYTEMTPELRARLLSYMLVEWTRIPLHRSLFVTEITNWLNEVLDKEPGFSAMDLDRLRLSFAVFTQRRADYATRNYNHPLFKLFECVVGDCIISGGAFFVTHALLHIAIPGLGFLPIPLAMGINTLRNLLYKNQGDPLTAGANRAVLALENRFYQSIGSQLSLKELVERWDVGLRSIKAKHASITVPGLLRGISADYGNLIANTKQPDREKSLALLLHMTKSMGSINPVEWREIGESFQIIRSTAINFGFNKSEVQPLFTEMKQIAGTWRANAVARKTVEDLADQPWDQQPLPEQLSASSAH
jgi:hypothetical protein